MSSALTGEAIVQNIERGYDLKQGKWPLSQHNWYSEPLLHRPLKSKYAIF